MNLILYTNIVSPHQLPVARELAARLGAANFRYVYTVAKDAERARLGWGDASVGCEFPVSLEANDPSAKAALETCDVLLVGGMRPVALIARRLAAGRTVLYMSERWFKPIPFPGLPNLLLPGWLRLASPSYFRMARTFLGFFRSPHYRYLPIGPWAARDMRLLERLLGWTVKGRRADVDYLPWGYFVAPSAAPCAERPVRVPGAPLKVLWVGRMMQLKRIDTLVRAIRRIGSDVSLTLVGAGEMRTKLERLSKGLAVSFHASVPIEQVRELMRSHDVYVFTSNGMDGWGAVVNEAMEEGMIVLGTRETGAAPAMLPAENLFHAGDVRRLATLLRRVISDDPSAPKRVPITPWQPKAAAERLLRVVTSS